ncbi:protocatechuate 3,4-dioxygenase [Rivibacter subsaxonicus]|uniref:Protocatechuate 3,4-dioxygenase alpha subunit n=1 Tax=Rivibacter subsaxonicus TaxID=457575 RepID=A0A4Q7VVM0_9BURK|nr:protocatechuate 3,4-dioxygenase [Rivibacter subsaxonicus]RZU00722.1 protocatechuate 3,4-dioxygenase alpha subunit [Rivibacter subsaxonicus]
MPALTPTQTIGPFPHEAWQWAIEASASGPLRIQGRLLDGAGQPVDDGWVEAFVPGAAAPAFVRCATGAQGEFSLALPATAGGAGEPAAWITVFARGLLQHQFSAVFLGDAPTLATAPLLAQLPEERRATLIARRDGVNGYRWDIHLQGEHETVFLDFE